MLRSEPLSLSQQQARLFQPAPDTHFDPYLMVAIPRTVMCGTIAAPAVMCMYFCGNTHLLGDDTGTVSADQTIPWSITEPHSSWTYTDENRRPLSRESIPSREHAARVSSILGLGKSQIARLLGVSRVTLYDWIKGEIEPQGRNAERLAALGCLVAEVCRDTERPLYHRFVETPLEGETESIMSLLRCETWDEPRLLVLLKRARGLTSERDQRLGIGKHRPESGRPDQDSILSDNLISLGLG